MSSKMLGWLIRLAVVLCAACGIFLCVYGYPVFCGIPGFASGDSISWAWLVLLYIVTVPCYVILAFVWLVSTDVMQETVFSTRTAKLVGVSAIIIFLTTVVLSIGTTVLLVIDSSFVFGYLMFVLMAAGLTFGIFAAVLSRYITKASILKEESDGTI